MRSGAHLTITCNGGKCHRHLELVLPFRRQGLKTWDGYYDHHPHTVDMLVRRSGWVVLDDKDFCSRECAAFAAKEKADA